MISSKPLGLLLKREGENTFLFLFFSYLLAHYYTGTWASSYIHKAHAFAHHLAGVFQPQPSENLPEDEEAITHFLETPYQLEPPIPRISRTEAHAIISSLHPHKSPGYDLITGRILQALPPVAIQFLTQLFNAALILGYFPAQWKVA
jgi:hypothetical protein